MYGAGMTCTIFDFRTANQADSMRHMKILRLHGYEGTSAVGVLTDNNRTNTIGRKYQHLGNSLIVSANAEFLGARNDGWRLNAPQDSEEASFLEYLDKNWEDLFYNEENADLDIIIVRGVVVQPNDDPTHDRYGDMVLHKLHLLYILAYYRHTIDSGE